MKAPDDEGPSFAKTAKLIADLDGLIQAMLRSLSPSKTWQRTLFAQLSVLDREIEVLRLSIVLERSDDEIRTAVASLQNTLALTDVQIAKARADVSTKAAVRLASRIARQIGSSMRLVAALNGMK